MRFTITSGHALVLRLIRQSKGLAVNHVTGLVHGTASAISILETTLHPITKHVELIEDFCRIYEITIDEFNDMAASANAMGLLEYEAAARKAMLHAMMDLRLGE
jgi:hypothetical protein